MILLDTHAAIWLARSHRRARPILRYARPYLSPASVLEIQFLVEMGRVQLARGLSSAAIAEDPRWRVDEPPAAAWFARATELAWTHDPFDRLIAAHALARGWRLATADEAMLAHLPPNAALAL